MTHTNGFDALHAHAQRLRGAAIPALLAAEPQRPTQYARQVGPLYFNFARQKYDRAALDALFACTPRCVVISPMHRSHPMHTPPLLRSGIAWAR